MDGEEHSARSGNAWLDEEGARRALERVSRIPCPDEAHLLATLSSMAQAALGNTSVPLLPEERPNLEEILDRACALRLVRRGYLVATPDVADIRAHKHAP